jgi:hypothetical protein
MTTTPLSEQIFSAERIACRTNEQSPWEWFGPPIVHTLSGAFDNWILETMQQEALCETLAKRYPTLEEYAKNCKRVVAPSLAALELVDLNEVDL